jgi:hypothetical protein
MISLIQGESGYTYQRGWYFYKWPMITRYPHRFGFSVEDERALDGLDGDSGFRDLPHAPSVSQHFTVQRTQQNYTS